MWILKGALLLRGGTDAKKEAVCAFRQQRALLKRLPNSINQRMQSVSGVSYTDQGPFILGAWYRLSHPETTPIEACEQEHEDFSVLELSLWGT